MRLLGTKPPPTWPVKVFWALVIIHAPVIAIMIATFFVEASIHSMITFWMVAVPSYLLSLLMSPLKLLSAIIGAYLVWYACQFDWTPLFTFFGGTRNFNPHIRGRRVQGIDEFRERLASRRRTLHGNPPTRPNPRGISRE